MNNERAAEATATNKKDITHVQELVYEMRVGQVMTREVVTVLPDSRMRDLRTLLRDRRISGVPVVDGGKLVGLISIEDFITCLAEGRMDASVRERMREKVVTLRENEPLVNAVDLFDRFGYGRFPVLDREAGNLVGVITKGDIVRGLLKQLEIDYHEEEIHRYRASHIFEDIIADEITLIFHYRVLARDFDRAGETSSGLKKTLSRLGLPPKIVRRIAIATYEAEMNIVVFTEGGEITAHLTPETISIEVVDKGPGIADIQQAMQPGFSTAPDWVREFGFGAGMGLPNIQKCADEMHLESTVGLGTRLEIVVHLKQSVKYAAQDRC